LPSGVGEAEIGRYERLPARRKPHPLGVRDGDPLGGADCPLVFDAGRR
jgi:hypothetical protein